MRDCKRKKFTCCILLFATWSRSEEKQNLIIFQTYLHLQALVSQTALEATHTHSHVHTQHFRNARIRKREIVVR